MIGVSFFSRRSLLPAVILFAAVWPESGFGLGVERSWQEPELEYIQRSWQAEEGLRSPVVRGIMQSGDGYLWLATDEGLTRFDGRRFVDFDRRRVSESYSRWVIDLAETEDGSIWASSSNGGLVQLRDGEIRHYTVEDGLNSNLVMALKVDRSGRLWIGTALGLMWLDEDGFHEFREDGRWVPRAVRAIEEDLFGNLWVGTSDGLLRILDGHLEVFGRSGGWLSDNSVMSLYVDREGNLWIGTAEGLTFHGVDGEVLHLTLADGLLHNTIRAVHQDSDGIIWIGTQGGLQRYGEDGLETVKVRDRGPKGKGGPILDLVYSVFEDREKNLWIGTSTGLTQLNRQKFRTIGQPEGLPVDVTTAVIEDSAENIWVGTWGGGLAKIIGDKIVTYTTADGLPSNHILALEESSDGSIWIGSGGDGVSRLRDGRFERYTFPGSRMENSIRVIYEDSRGRIWFGGNSGLTLYEDGEFRSVTELFGLDLKTIAAIGEDRDGAIWVGSSAGLTRLDGSGFRTYSTEDGLPSAIVIMVYPDEDGSLWFGTEGGGLCRLRRDGTIHLFTGADELFRERILQVLLDDFGFFWMITRNGIYRVSREELIALSEGRDVSVFSVTYGKMEGMRRAQGNAIAQPATWKSRDGRFWFVTLGGLVYLNPAEMRINTVPPPLLIEQVKVDNLVYDPEELIRIPPGRGRLEVRYTALSFQAAEKIRFQYMLEGFDTEWQDGEPSRIASYSNLRPQSYRFRVRARNSDGIWSEEDVTFGFVLAPYFYQTIWFYVFCSAGLVGTGAVAYRFRVSQIRARHDHLAVLVEARTRELQTEISERRLAQKRTAVFSRLGQALSRASTQKEAAETILAVADELIGWDACILHAYSEETDERVALAGYDLFEGKRMPIPPEKLNPTGCDAAFFRTIRQGPRLVLRKNEEEVPGSVRFGNLDRQSAALMFVPLRHGEATVGVLSIQSYHFDAFDEKDLETLQALADYCGGAFERIRAEEALRESQELVLHQERLAAIGQLSSGIAHEFNNILTIIQGHCSLLLHDELPEGMVSSVKEIAGSTERAASLTRQLLTFSRKQYMQPEILDLNRVVGEIVGMLKRVLEERFVVTCEFSEELAPVRADPGMMEQIVMNLVVNARDAMSENGGALTISTENVELEAGHNHPEGRAGKFVMISVSDTGHGMDASVQHQIFEPFFTTKAVGEGTGLGLSSVYGIVKQHRGWIEVLSEPGAGSTFRIFLPAVEPVETRGKERLKPPVAPEWNGRNETVLLVEDEPGLREMSCRFLTALSYRVLEAGDGAEALEIWERHSGEIDLLFTDMVLPGEISGYDLLQRLREKKSGLPVILTSGYSQEITGGAIAEERSITFLPKPYLLAEVGELIRGLLAGPG